MSEYETKDTTKSEREKKRKRFPMMPKDEFDIRFENNPDFDTPDMSRAKTGGLMSCSGGGIAVQGTKFKGIF
jgi:hypothetical protein